MEPENPVPVKASAPSGLRLAVLFISAATGFQNAFIISSLNISIPAINQEFKPDAVLLSWIVTSFILSIAVFSVPFGRIADIVGIRKIFTIGIITLILGMAFSAASRSVGMLIISLIIQGVSNAMIAGPGLAMIVAVFPRKERGRGMGILVASVYIAYSLGPYFGGMLTEHLGWRSIFLFDMLICLMVLFCLLWKIKGEWVGARGEKFDYVGSAVFGLTLVSLIYGFSRLPALLGCVLIFIGVIGILAFFKWESLNPSPILNVDIFRSNRIFVFSNLAALFSYMTTTGTIFMTSLYLQYVKGLSAPAAGLIILAQPVVQATLSPFIGRLSDKTGPHILASAGMMFLCAGLIMLSLVTRDTPITYIIISLIVFGTGFGLFSSPNISAIMNSAAPKYYAVAGSLAGTVRTIGQTLSMGVATVVISVVIGRVAITPQLYPSFLTCAKIVYGILAVLCFAGVFISLARTQRNKSEPVPKNP